VIRNNERVNGWLILDKSEGITSAKAVNIVKRLTGADKAGHAGTLDPFASGVLPIALGEATKTMQFAVDSAKEYEFTAVFGESRDTGDREGRILESSKKIPSEAEIRAAIPQFIGEIMQTPPQYSAIKINGERAYDLARRGEKADIKSRSVTVHSLEFLAYNAPEVRLKMRCGKGVYVRSIAMDLAAKLGTYAYVSTLRRTLVGKFSASIAISLESLEKIVHIPRPGNDLPGILLPVEAALDDIPVLEITTKSAQKLCQGQLIKIENTPETEHLRIVSAGKFMAMAEVRDGFLKPVRVFNI